MISHVYVISGAFAFPVLLLSICAAVVRIIEKDER